MRSPDPDRKRRRIVPAPAPSNPRLHAPLLSVGYAADQDVQWQWTETAEGRFVSGYQLVPRLPKPRL